VVTHGTVKLASDAATSSGVIGSPNSALSNGHPRRRLRSVALITFILSPVGTSLSERHEAFA
jgi:hypothetical protein